MPDNSIKNIVDLNTQVLINNYLLANLNDSGLNYNEFMKEFEKQIIESALYLTHYNQKRASSILRLNPPP